MWTELKQARQAKALTYRELADAIQNKVSWSTLYTWETKGMPAAFQSLKSICIATGVTPNELLGVGDRSYPYDDPIPSFTEEELETMRAGIAYLKEEAKKRVMEENIHRVDPDALNKVKVCWAIEEKIDMIENWSRLRG
jgi:transcriptional regulator with XRE-family HTH domain